MRSADTPQPLPLHIDQEVLKFTRLAMATMSTQTYEVFPDGALCDRQLYNLFIEFKQQCCSDTTGVEK